MGKPFASRNDRDTPLGKIDLRAFDATMQISGVRRSPLDHLNALPARADDPVALQDGDGTARAIAGTPARVRETPGAATSEALGA